jgi:hypothetical protein
MRVVRALACQVRPPDDDVLLMDDPHLELLSAATRLPPGVARWAEAALRSGRYQIGYRRFETDLHVCPIVAGAKLAGIWHDGGVLPGHDEWGTPDAPAPDVWHFVCSFDWYADTYGVDEAVHVVLNALSARESRRQPDRPRPGCAGAIRPRGSIPPRRQPG